MADKAPTGSAILDDMAGGGFPRGRVTLIDGEPGSGKTILSLQFLLHGAERNDEPGILVCFEETAEEIAADATALDWDIAKLRADGRFDIIEGGLGPDVTIQGRFDLQGLLAALGARADAMGATRVAFDSIDVLLDLLGDEQAARRELYRLKQWVRERDMTCVLTGKIDETGSSPTSRSSFLNYFSNACIELRRRHVDQVAVRTICVTKLRGSASSSSLLPFIIGPRGITVADPGSAEVRHKVSTERVSSGVARLDEFLGGGYLRGSAILVSGVPGTAKTSLAVSFLETACRRGSKSLLVSFDEAGEQIVRNAASIGLDLQPQVDEGLLRILSLRSGAAGIEDHIVNIMAEMDRLQPDCMVIDPLSATHKAPGQVHAITPGQRLMDHAKREGITLLMTSLTEKEAQPGSHIDTASNVSTIADTWLHLTFAVNAGERNRAISIVKSRGTSHSHQVRELVISDQGIDLVDVYVLGGEVLMGTARKERQFEMEREERIAEREFDRRRKALLEERRAMAAELDRLKGQVELRDQAIEELEEGEDERQRMRSERRRRISLSRHSNPESESR